MTFSRLLLVVAAFSFGCRSSQKAGQDTAAVRATDTAAAQDTAAPR